MPGARVARWDGRPLPLLAQAPAADHRGRVLDQHAVDHHGRRGSARPGQLVGDRAQRPGGGEQAGQLVVDEVAGRVAVGGLAHRHQQGGPQGLAGRDRQVDHEGGQAGRDLPGRAVPPDPDGQGQDDAGPPVAEAGRQGDPAPLEQPGAGPADLGGRRAELFERLAHRGSARGGQQRRQLRAGVDGLAEPGADLQVADRPLAAVAHSDPVVERGLGADHRRDGGQLDLQRRGRLLGRHGPGRGRAQGGRQGGGDRQRGQRAGAGPRAGHDPPAPWPASTLGTRSRSLRSLAKDICRLACSGSNQAASSISWSWSAKSPPTARIRK